MVLGVLVVSLVATLIGRLWYLQVLAGDTFRAQALDNQIRDIVTEAPRGEIVDDKGRPFVTNKTALVVSVDRTKLLALPQGGKSVVLHRLSKVIHQPFDTLRKEIRLCGTNAKGHVIRPPCYAGSPYQPIPVSKLKPGLKATRQAWQITDEQEKFPGVSAQLTAVRHYPKPQGAWASSILGYINPINAEQLKALPEAQQNIMRNTYVGATGVEQSYEQYLHGTPGLDQVTVDHVGAVTGTVKDTEPVQGDSIVLNIDAKAQATLEQQLQDAINTARRSGYTGDYAAGVVLNARTGGIVAMASNPTYNPSKPPPLLTTQRYKTIAGELGHPFLDKAFDSSNPPGSTFKPISASGLIADGTLSASDPASDCPSTFQNRTNFEGESGKGYISLHEALVISCDTFFFQLGDQDWNRDQALIKAGKKPREGVQHMARDYGFGENPGLDLPVSLAGYGHIADRYNTKLNWEQNKDNYCKGAQTRPKGSYLQQIDAENCKSGFVFLPGEQENEDVGQGSVTVSPLQLAVAYAAIANGGTVFEPRVVKAIISPTGKVVKRIHAPVRDHLPISQSTLAYLRASLLGVTHETAGTAYGVFAGYPFAQVDVGGKTGTAEISGTQENDSWFASFGGPTGQKPQYVTVIEVDKSNQGAISAAPFVKNMWDALYGFGGTKAIFKNGVPPHKLPKVGAAAVKEKLHKRKMRRKAHRQLLRQQQQRPPGTTTTTTPTTPTTPTSSTGALGLPSVLPPERRGRAP